MPSAPTVMNEDTLHSLELAFMCDFNVSQACLHANISRDTYYSYIQRNTNLADRFARMRRYPVSKAKAVIADSLVKGNVNTAKWLLERRDRENYGNQTEININVLANLSDKQLETRITQLETRRQILAPEEIVEGEIVK